MAYSHLFIYQQHIDVWVDMLWTFRQADADWAIAGTFFSPCVMANNIRSYWANGVKYQVPWSDVEKVFNTLYFTYFLYLFLYYLE